MGACHWRLNYDFTERCAKIASRLREATAPIFATALASEFHVSCQVIVGTWLCCVLADWSFRPPPRGYVLAAPPSGVVGVLACVHDRGDMERELTVIVDNGGEVVDVIVEHAVYGQLTGQLHLRSRHDVAQFMQQAANAAPLSSLTGGIHLHTVRCPDEPTLRRVIGVLNEEGFLLEE